MTDASAPLFASIEAGGTKFVLGLGSAEGGSLVHASVPTRAPDETLADVAAFFAEAGRGRTIAAVGVATFGPVDIDPSSASYGHILPSPKLAWNDTDLLGRVRAMLGGAPGVIDTDVNAAALAEARYGAGAGAGADDDLAYVTIGTGIGIGLVVGGRPVHGIAHPELGHILPRRAAGHDRFAGICPFHGDCLEGVASGPAIQAAWGGSLADLPGDHPAWGVEADYVAQLCAVLMLATAPRLIVLGGGVMKQEALFKPIRNRAATLLAGYGRLTDRASLETRIVPPGCREPSGLVGGYMLAEQALAAG